MSDHFTTLPGQNMPGWSRRRFLARNALGVGSVALAWLLREDNLLGTPPNMPRQTQSFDLKPKSALLRPQARAMISLFMHGGPSHVDLFDPKPALSRRSREDFPGEGDIAASAYTVARQRGGAIDITERPVRFTIVKPGQSLLKEAAE